MIRVAVVGAGAASEKLHLPALGAFGDLRVTWLVDADVARARELGRLFDIPRVTADYREVDDIDVALIVTPHNLHVPMAEFFLRRRVHVLVEKPLALRVDDAERVVELARAQGVVLAVGVFRRYYPVADLVRQAIASEWLGPVERVDVEEGWPYDWNAQSSFLLSRERAGGGVLIDTGSHTLDRILWWFDGATVSVEAYMDNAHGGVESDCVVHLSLLWRGRTIPVRAELSRTRQLRNTFQVFTTCGSIETPVNVPHRAWLSDRRLSDGTTPIALDLRPETLTDHKIGTYFVRQFQDFCAAIRTGAMPRNAASTVLPTVRLIESCYAVRTSLEEPWVCLGLDRPLLTPTEAHA